LGGVGWDQQLPKPHGAVSLRSCEKRGDWKSLPSSCHGAGRALAVPLLGGICCTYRLSAHFCDSDLLLPAPSKSTSLSRTQSIDLTSIQIEMYQSLISLLALAAYVNAGTPHIIDVGEGGALTFSPDSLTAAVGDT